MYHCCRTLSLFLVIFKIFPVHRFDHEVESRGHADQTSHGVHCVVVEEGAGVNSS